MAGNTEVQLRQQVVPLKVSHAEQISIQGEELHRVSSDNLGFAERLDKANVEI